MIDQPKLTLKEGWHVLHLFYRIEHGSWELLSNEEKLAAKTALAALVQEARTLAHTQLLTLSIVSPKADIGFILMTEDLHTANLLEKRLSLSLGPDILNPVFSFYSLTERSEYMTSEEDFRASLEQEKGLKPGSAEFENVATDFRNRMQKYVTERVSPILPDWPVVSFYPMSKRRGEVQNWYVLDFAQRKQLMRGHGQVGKQYAGRVKQVITGSTGLEEWEWGVTLFAHDVAEIKSIVYEMRFDTVSARYAEFGDFFIGLQMPLDRLFQRVLL